MFETIIVIHPLSFRRGVAYSFFNFLTSRGFSITFLKEVSVCATTASVLEWTYNDTGWGRPRDTIAFITHSAIPPDEVIGLYTPKDCGSDTLKGHFYSDHLSKHDSLLAFAAEGSKKELYRDIFSLKPS